MHACACVCVGYLGEMKGTGRKNDRDVGFMIMPLLLEFHFEDKIELQSQS